MTGRRDARGAEEGGGKGREELSPARFSFVTLHFRHPRWLWLLFVPGGALSLGRGLLRGAVEVSCPVVGRDIVDVVGAC